MINFEPLTVEPREVESWRIHVPAITIEERMHRDRHMLVWQARGATDFVIDEDRCMLRVGQALWIPQGTRHAFTVRENSVLLPMTFRTNVTATTLDRTTRINVNEDLRNLFLVYLQSANSIVKPMMNAGRQILAIIEERSTAVTNIRMPVSEPALTVAKVLRLHPGDSRTAEQLAASVHASARTVERIFLAETGMSLGRWRNKNRMEAASALLRSSMNINGVAWRVGYTNVSSFGRAFKSYFGMPPSEYMVYCGSGSS